ncbi:MAG: DNA replication/repair protein RecF [Clostridia bacterium]|nr:DNA replication/repair protein RecF [Clostridia bacterium]
MNVTKIEFNSFRNIESETVEFSDGINVIYGENAQGKTNILEGIYLFARGKSFRAFKDKELVNFDSNVAYAKMDFKSRDEETRLGVEISKSQSKKFYRNNVKVNKTSEIIGEFRAVLFCPSHLGIIKDAPSVRRKFIDVAISQLRPVYLKMMTRYNQVLEERNTIIKMNPQEREANEALIDVYSEELAALCADIADIRNDYIKKLDHWVKIFFNEMTDGKEAPKITYESNGTEADFENREALKQRYLHLLTDYKEREYKYGATLFGIHKDDLKIEINGRDSRLYSSQGQQRSLALSMKMAEGEISRESKGEYPVFLFDDVLSELDDSRKKYILSNIKGKQVIITACDRSVFENNERCHFINIKNGKRGEISNEGICMPEDEYGEKTPETEL